MERRDFVCGRDGRHCSNPVYEDRLCVYTQIGDAEGNFTCTQIGDAEGNFTLRSHCGIWVPRCAGCYQCWQPRRRLTIRPIGNDAGSILYCWGGGGARLIFSLPPSRLLGGGGAGFYTEFFDLGGCWLLQWGGGVSLYTPQWGYLVMGGVVCAKGGGG